MEHSRLSYPGAVSPRRFREQSDERSEHRIDVTAPDEQFQVHVTDEPGGDPYNHTGNFRRLYR